MIRATREHQEKLTASRRREAVRDAHAAKTRQQRREVIAAYRSASRQRGAKVYRNPRSASRQREAKNPYNRRLALYQREQREQPHAGPLKAVQELGSAFERPLRWMVEHPWWCLPPSLGSIAAWAAGGVGLLVIPLMLVLLVAGIIAALTAEVIRDTIPASKADARRIDWLKRPLPDRPGHPHYGWTVDDFESAGSAREALDRFMMGDADTAELERGLERAALGYANIRERSPAARSLCRAFEGHILQVGKEACVKCGLTPADEAW